MDEVSTTGVYVAVAIFITAAIASILFMSFGELKSIFGITKEIDADISEQFGDYYIRYYTKYHNKTITGLGLANLITELEDNDDDGVVLTYTGRENVISQANNESKRESVYIREKMAENIDSVTSSSSGGKPSVKPTISMGDSFGSLIIPGWSSSPTAGTGSSNLSYNNTYLVTVNLESGKIKINCNKQ